MAGRFGLSSSAPATFLVTITPAPDLAYTNLAYCSQSDLRTFAVPDSKLFLALVGDSFVLSLSAHESIPSGQIALNTSQRRHARVSAGDMISMSRFIPPENFQLALLTLEIEFVKKGTKSELVDAVLLSNQFKKRFIDQVMTAGQRVLFEYHGDKYNFTVNQAVVEGKEKSKTIERGMISGQTYFVFGTSNASEIKAGTSEVFKGIGEMNPIKVHQLETITMKEFNHVELEALVEYLYKETIPGEKL